MRIYFLYILTAIFNFYLIMFLWGVSAGFASYLPIVAIIGSLLIFTIATPILVFKTKTGLILGVIFSLMILPYNITYIIGIIGDSRYHDFGGILSSIPSVLNLLTLYLAARILISKNFSFVHFPDNQISKIILSCIPLALFVIYVLSIAGNFDFKQ